VPPEACNQLTKAVGSTDAVDVCLETGHIGIYVSSKFQRQFAPRIAQWLKERDQEETPQPSAVKKAVPVRREARLKRNKPVKKKPTVKKKTARAPKTIRLASPGKKKLSLIQKIAEAI